MKQFCLCGLGAVGLALGFPRALAQEWFHHLDESLHVQSADGQFNARLSGLFDLEGYYVDQRPGGLIFGGGDSFVNPRLSLFLEGRLGPHFYSFAQARVDRGFDPRVRRQDARFDEYLIRYTPFDNGHLNFQLGKFATVAGNFVQRHDSWQNPLITAPLPYENVFNISDQAAPASPGAFLARRSVPDKKTSWLPLLWGPSYASGGSVFGSVEKFDYAFEIKNASISSRPSVWDARDWNFDYPTTTGRLGFRPSASWNLGVSGSVGPYLISPAERTLPAGRDLSDYFQESVSADLSYSHHHWQLWAEIFASRFEVPNVGGADSISGYVEAKYKFTAQLFGALRWNQQLFGDVANGRGGQEPWDRDLWRIDSALGYRFSQHLQAKVQYSYTHEQGKLQQGEQLVAAQVTLKF